MIDDEIEEKEEKEEKKEKEQEYCPHGKPMQHNCYECHQDADYDRGYFE